MLTLVIIKRGQHLNPETREVGPNGKREPAVGVGIRGFLSLTNNSINNSFYNPKKLGHIEEIAYIIPAA